MQARRVQDLFLWSMSFVYLWAFASLYYQVPGLYGDDGLLPVRGVLKCDSEKWSDCALFGDRPSGLYLLRDWTGLSPSHAMEFACILGIVISALSILFSLFRDFFSYIALWYLYFSVFQVGQTFLWFQWDTLLIEAGFLTALVAPIQLLRFGRKKPLPHDRISLFLVRWLVFRMMFASGIVKLTSECPTWWNLTGANVYQARFGKFYSFMKWLGMGATFGLLGYWFCNLFTLRATPSPEGVGGWAVLSDVAFTKEDLYRCLAWAVPLLIILGTLCFLSEIISAICRCWVDFRSKFFVAEIWASIQCLVVIVVATIMFSISLVPFSWLDRGASEMLWPEIKQIHEMSDKYQLTHSYGLFRSMTGVGGRPEVIVEGAMSMEGPWKEYEFLYKPGTLSRPPPFVVPHQPRIDWQMWFAALGKYQQNPWFLSLIYRLLIGQPEVLKLIDQSQNPFPGKPPKFIRAQLYKYHYTSLNSTDKHHSTKDWWWRELEGEYFPAIDAENTSLTDFLKNNGLLVSSSVKTQRGMLHSYMSLFRDQVEKVGGPEFVWAVTIAVILASLGKKITLG